MPLLFEQFLQEEISALLAPLANADASSIRRLFAGLGWDLDALSGLDVDALVTVAKALKEALEGLGKEGAEGGIAAVLRLNSVQNEIGRVYRSIETWVPPSSLPAETPAWILEDLFHGLIDAYLVRRHPLLHGALVLTGLLDEEAPSPILIGTRVVRQQRPRPKLRLDRIGEVLRSPLGYVDSIQRDQSGAERTSEGLSDILFPLLAAALDDLGIDARYGGLVRTTVTTATQDELDAAERLLITNFWVPVDVEGEQAFSLQRIIFAIVPASDGSGPALLAATSGNVQILLDKPSAQFGFSISHLTKAIVIGRNGIEFTGTLGKDLLPNVRIIFKAPGADSQGPAFSLGSSGSLQFMVNKVEASADLLTAAAPDVVGSIALTGVTFTLGTQQLDGFLAQILPQQGSSFQVDLAFTVSLRHGIRFSGSAEAEKVWPTVFRTGGLKVGPVKTSIRADSSGLSVSVVTSATVNFGPLVATIESLGIRMALGPADRAGELGPIALKFGVVGPKGAGLAIDAGAVVGVGYLSFDVDKQLYSGFVQLEIAEILNVTAVGLITTQMPDGSPGFSLLVLIAAQFSPPIQLGYGFTLNGLGGLLGVNRTAAVDVLRAGLRAGTLGSVLFPVDPVHNAARIVSDLGAVFPPAEGRFVFGPMAILGWGPKTLIMLQLGLVLELPEPVRLLILGRLLVVLPEEKHAVIRLQLDSLGVIDFATGDVSLDAVLYDSEIKGFTITGEMALRANFGASPGFLVAVGGFHPAFKAPTGFPSLQRVAISLATGDNPRLRLAAYMALTTNTVQFGALLDLYARLGEFSVEGHLGFDALIQFNPFGLVASLGAMVAVKSSGRVLLGIMLEMGLTGPTPWHAWGKARFQILLFPVTVEFSVQVGEAQPPSLPAPVQLRPLLREALKDPHNWATQLPRGEHPLVVFRDQPQGTELLVHPLADLRVSQRVIPLGREITRFGNTFPEGERSFILGIVGPDGIVRTEHKEGVEPVEDLFAPAQFREMSDDEKLGAPAFEKHPSGIRFAMQGYDCGPPVVEDEMLYEESTIPATAAAGVPGAVASAVPAAAPLMAEPYALTTAFVTRVTPTGAVGLAPLHHTGRAKYRVAGVEEAPGFRLKPRGYTIAGGGPSKRYESYLAAVDALRERQALRPQEKARLRVVPD